jgi:hypothetical protein
MPGGYENFGGEGGAMPSEGGFGTQVPSGGNAPPGGEQQKPIKIPRFDFQVQFVWQPDLPYVPPQEEDDNQDQSGNPAGPGVATTGTTSAAPY